MAVGRAFASLTLAIITLGALAENDEVCDASSGKPCSPEEKKAERDAIEDEIRKSCPLYGGIGKTLGLAVLRSVTKPTSLLSLLGLWPSGISKDGWADEYTTMMYMGAGSAMLRLYKARDKSYVKIPTAMSDPRDILQVENVLAPRLDVDGTPNFFWFESAAPSFIVHRVYTPMLTCSFSLMRRLNADEHGSFADDLEDPNVNTWEVAMAGSGYKSKLEWVKAFYNVVKTWDGKPFWPVQMTNFQTYFKQDEWDDHLEQAWAFRLIASHRVESGSWTFDNVAGAEKVELPFRIPLNVFSTLAIRPGFGKYGVDLYFNSEGLPVLLETTTGQIVTRGDKSWQYWKFVWRSSLITVITLVDHLHMTHFRASNLMARSTRIALQPENPLRRVMSIFTFGAIFVNFQAMHTLVGSNHMLHRATPFKDFEQLSNIVPSALLADLPDVQGLKQLLNDDEWDKLHPKLQEAPFYADGRLLMKAIQRYLSGVGALMMDQMCDEKGDYTHMFKELRFEFLKEMFEAHYSVPGYMSVLNSSCDVMANALFSRMASYVFTVTGWHRHVGFVGDYYLDPSLATMSWKDGELLGRPRQHMLMTVINVFTSTHQPLLKEDFTHLFKGMQPDLEKEFTDLWHAFQADLSIIEEEIDKRNEGRDVKNINMSPRILEAAVSK